MQVHAVRAGSAINLLSLEQSFGLSGRATWIAHAVPVWVLAPTQESGRTAAAKCREPGPLVCRRGDKQLHWVGSSTKP